MVGGEGEGGGEEGEGVCLEGGEQLERGGGRLVDEVG